MKPDFDIDNDWPAYDGRRRQFHLRTLMLAVANSSFAVAFYDAVCGNRLYAGRRRFITQYVKRFPIPNVDDATQGKIHRLVEKLRTSSAGSDERAALEDDLDSVVWAAFGLFVGQSSV